MRIAALALVAASLGACVSSHTCAASIPDDLRADAIRVVLDKKLCGTDQIPQDDLSLALGSGHSYRSMSEERRQELARWAAGYANCVKERTSR